MGRTLLLRILVSLVVLGACAFLVISLATFEKNDLSAYHLPAASPVHNAGGVVGAVVADFLWQGLGVGAGVLVGLAVGWCVLHLLGRGSERIVQRAAGAAVLVACVCAFANEAGAAEGLVSHGGAVGLALSDVVHHYFGSAGQWMLGVPVTLIALMMLSVDEVLVPPVLRTGARVAAAVRARRARRQERAQAAAPPEPQAALLQEAETEVAEDEPPTEAAGPADLPRDTGRPFSAGYLDHVEQEGASQSAPGEEDPAEALDVAAGRRRGTDPARPYVLPSLDLLDEANPLDRSRRGEHIQQQIAVLERTLAEFGVGAKVVNIEQGPVVTRYELTLQAGTKLSRVTALSDDLAIATKAPAVRIVAPIPGKSTIGIELPNAETELVRLSELLASEAARARQWSIPLFLGKDASGQPIVCDLTRMPHLLIAGATGSGKSVCINAIIGSILFTQHPDDVRIILIDPKVVELAHYGDLPHLLTPVVTDMKRAAWILDWACKTMDERYDTLARVGVRSIAAYNRLGEEEIRCRLGEDADDPDVPFHLPYIVIIVDELADMMMLASKNIESSITRLAQKSRAVGLHIILATQRPSVDVITGLIKSNLPTRISFQVTSKVDSRTILDRNGAEKLLGCGDMLFLAPGCADLIRAQGTYVSDEEVQRVVGFINQQRQPDFPLDLGALPATLPDDEAASGTPEGFGEDELYEEACRVVLATRRGSVSLLQRKLEIGYTRAARLIDMMAQEGIVGEYKGAKAREVVLGLEEWEARRRGGPPADRPAPQLDPDLLEESRRLEEDDDEDDDDP